MDDHRSTAQYVPIPGVRGSTLTREERRDQIYRHPVRETGNRGGVYPPDQFSPSGWYPPYVAAPLPPQASSPWANARMAPTLPQNSAADLYRSGVEFAPTLEMPLQLKPAYQNGYPGQPISFKVPIPGTSYPAHMAQVPNFAVPQVRQHNGVGALQPGVWNQHNILLEASNSAAKKRSLLLELPHLLGYMIGMIAIFGLYLIVPMMILLNATLPGSWNKLMIAAGILVIGEIAICVILVKTIPRRKSKHKHKTHRRDALARPYQRT